MAEQAEGNESNTTVASRAKGFQDLVHAGVKEALSGDAASMDTFEKAIAGPQSRVMELAILAIAQNDAGLEGVFNVSVATAVSSAVAKRHY